MRAADADQALARSRDVPKGVAGVLEVECGASSTTTTPRHPPLPPPQWRFTLRGKRKVDAQWKLFMLVQNIEKIGTYAPA